MIVKNLTRNKYKGIHQTKNISPITRLIYRAKFLQEVEAIAEISNILYLQLQEINFDIIVPVQATKSKISLPGTLAEILSKSFSVKFAKNGLKKGNADATATLKGKRVLILDDVVYSGKTARKAIKAVKRQKPEIIYFLAVAHSNTNYKI